MDLNFIITNREHIFPLVSQTQGFIVSIYIIDSIFPWMLPGSVSTSPSLNVSRNAVTDFYDFLLLLFFFLSPHFVANIYCIR